MNRNTPPDDAVDATRSGRDVSNNRPGRGRALFGKVPVAPSSTSTRPWPTPPRRHWTPRPGLSSSRLRRGQGRPCHGLETSHLPTRTEQAPRPDRPGPGRRLEVTHPESSTIPRTPRSQHDEHPALPDASDRSHFPTWTRHEDAQRQERAAPRLATGPAECPGVQPELRRLRHWGVGGRRAAAPDSGTGFDLEVTDRTRRMRKPALKELFGRARTDGDQHRRWPASQPVHTGNDTSLTLCHVRPQASTDGRRGSNHSGPVPSQVGSRATPSPPPPQSASTSPCSSRSRALNPSVTSEVRVSARDGLRSTTRHPTCRGVGHDDYGRNDNRRTVPPGRGPLGCPARPGTGATVHGAVRRADYGRGRGGTPPNALRRARRPQPPVAPPRAPRGLAGPAVLPLGPRVPVQGPPAGTAGDGGRFLPHCHRPGHPLRR